MTWPRSFYLFWTAWFLSAAVHSDDPRFRLITLSLGLLQFACYAVDLMFARQES